MSGSDGQDRNQKATPRRMKEVRKKGGLSRSHDVATWTATALGLFMLPTVARNTRTLTVQLFGELGAVAADPTSARALGVMEQAARSSLWLLLPLFAALFLVVLVAQVAQGGVHPVFRLHTESLNPVNGVKRLFGPTTWWEAAKTLLKSLAVGLVVCASLRPLWPFLMGSGRISLVSVLQTGGSATTAMLRAGVLAGVGLGVVDLVVVLRRNRKKTRMTLQEVKEESKSTEGDPHVKAAVRSRQRAMSRNRMMASIRDADVVLVNPTHVAVALRYQPGKGAPRVVAKGAGALAARIRAEASRHRVPTVEDVPLARALYAACELDQEIPDYLFMAVARVLAFVIALRRRGAAAGEHRSPGGTTLPELVDADHVAVARDRRRTARAARVRVRPVATSKPAQPPAAPSAGPLDTDPGPEVLA